MEVRTRRRENTFTCERTDSESYRKGRSVRDLHARHLQDDVRGVQHHDLLEQREETSNATSNALGGTESLGKGLRT